MKILITGYSGFFSKEFIDLVSSSKRIKLSCISRKKKKSQNINFWRLDLSKKNLKNLPKDKFFDLIIHSSFIKMHKNSNDKLLEKNFNITKNFIKIIKQNRFKKIINLSSTSVYPNINGKFSEKSEVNFFENTDNVYGLSKYIAEKLFEINIEINKLIHLRVANIIGNDNDESIISKMKKTLKKSNYIEIYGNGERIINLIHVKSLVKYILLLANKNCYGALNISDYSISIKNLANILIAKYGNNNSLIKYKKVYYNSPRFYINTSKFFKILNIKKPKKNELYNEI